MIDILDKIDQDIAWRKKELTNIYLNCEEYPALTRCYLVRTYAHWEGFVKTSINEICAELRNKKILFRELPQIFTTLKTKEVFENYRDKNKKKSGYTKLDEINKKIHNIRESAFDLKEIKCGAFDYQAFKFLLKIFQFDEKRYELRQQWFESLFNARHSIAHGKKHQENFDNIQGIHTELEKYLSLFKEDINSYIENKKYLVVLNNVPSCN